MTFEPFLAFFDLFFTRFEPFLTLSGATAPFLDQNMTILGSFWGDFGPFFLGRSGLTLGLLWGSFWQHFGVVLVSF